MNPVLKKIFISIPWFHPAFRAGGPIQSVYNLVDQMQGAFDFYIFTGDKDLDGSLLSGVRRNAWVQFNSSTKVYYAEKENRSNKLMHEIKDLKPHRVFVIGLFDWYFNIVPMLYSPVPCIVSVRGMLHGGALTQKSWKKKIFIGLFNLFGLNHKHLFHATDANEEREIKNALGTDAKVFIAGNFPRAVHFIEKSKAADVLELITVALISPMKNHLKVILSLQQVKAKVNYHIYGPVKDPAYWHLCVAEKAKLPANVDMIYHGEIQPQLIPSILGKGDLFIMPSVSENYGHSIVEALFAGLPVITSNNVPWQNLGEAKAGINVQDDLTSLSKAIDRFAAMSDAEFQEWKRGARDYAVRNTNVAEVYAAHTSMFES